MRFRWITGAEFRTWIPGSCLATPLSKQSLRTCKRVRSEKSVFNDCTLAGCGGRATCASVSWGEPPRGRTVRGRLRRRRWLSLGVLRIWCSHSIAPGCYTTFSPLLNLCYFRCTPDFPSRRPERPHPTIRGSKSKPRALISAGQVVSFIPRPEEGVRRSTCASVSSGEPPRERTVRQRLRRRRWLSLGVLRIWCSHSIAPGCYTVFSPLLNLCYFLHRLLSP